MANPFHLVVNDTDSAFHDVWLLIPNWKWIAIAAALVLGFFLLKALRPLLRSLNQRLSGRFPEGSWPSFFLQEDLHRPVSLMIVAGLWLVTWAFLEIPGRMGHFFDGFTQLLLCIGLVRIAYMAVEAVGDQLETHARGTENSFDDQLAPFITKALKVFVVLIGFLMILQNFGVNVVSLLAGLGLGGLALALAAQDTAANLFGSIMILLDQPFHVGDWIKMGDVEGIVEEVGFRSTRIRTFYKSVITIPNASVAKEKIDNYSTRDMRRLRQRINLTYDSRRENIELFMQSVKAMLIQHPMVNSPDAGITLDGLGDFAIQLTMTCFLKVKDGDQETAATQEILLNLRQLALNCHVSMALPSQTLYHVLPPDPAVARPQQPSPPSN